MIKIDNNCDKCGNCSCCGECCAATLPLTRKEEKTIRKYIKDNNITPEFFQNETDMNLQCCFYDRTNKCCKIYEVRPSICRSFKCNRNKDDIEREKFGAHTKAYWNHLDGDKMSNITDMRLLFYDDPRSLLANLIYGITDELMNCNEDKFEFLKWYLKKGGQEELANKITGEYQ